MQNFFFIGGAPLTGKSTLIRKLRGYVSISTDEIRSLLKGILAPIDYPDLFYDEGLNAVQFYEKYKTAEMIFDLEQKQALCTQRGITALLKAQFNWEKIAIEGHAITPEYVAKLSSDKSLLFKVVFLYDVNEERVRERIYKRGLYDDPDKYADTIKEIELQWVMMYNNYYQTEAKKYGFELLNVDNIDDFEV